MSEFVAGWLIGLVCLSLGVALAALYALAKFSIAAGRFDLDAISKAWNLRRAIDEAVTERVAVVGRPSFGAPQSSSRIGEQPPDPNVQQRRVLDEVAEMEREMNRMMGDSEAPRKRDRAFRNEQPAAPGAMEV